MGKLKDSMLEEMKLRNLSPRTIKVYMSNVEAFSKYFGKSPALMGEKRYVSIFDIYAKRKSSVGRA